ncbi:MAG: LEA type 2 family protein [Methanofollis sp.]|uniref:LEA type 2 family protein n=1 Tax=Methanofollis sp. TaxID=2052835 RepID=UPI002605F2EB|nr:LEA type 2 family protein [Methanofollis sp.]MDD4254934.1 LEA type 2 family protein [Methanofollis sp.]
MRLAPALAALVITAFIAGCAGGPPLRPPDVTVTGIAVTALTLESMDLEVILAVDNPNSVGATIRDVSVNVSYSKNGREVFLGSGRGEEISIPAYNTTEVVIPVTTDNLAMLSAAGTLALSGELEVTAEGTMTVDAGIVSFDVPFGKTTTVSVRGR